MRESNGPSVVCNNVRNSLLSDLLLNDFAELESGLLLVNLMRLESSLDIIENSEIFISFFNCHNIHLTEWESGISSDLSIDLNKTSLVLDYPSSLVSGKSVLESLLQKHGKWNAFSKLVRTGGWSGSVNSLEFSKIPLMWSSNSFDNLSLSFIALKLTEKYC